jgi:hypothetical protein
MEEERRVKMMKTTSRLVLNSCSASWANSEEGRVYQVSHWGGEDAEDDEDDQQVGSEPLLSPASNSEEGRKYQVSYGGGEKGEDDEDDQQIGSELLMPTQKRVGSIKYPMEEERRVKMMKTTSRLVLNSCSASWCQLRRWLGVSSILWRRRGGWRWWRRPAGWFWTPLLPTQKRVKSIKYPMEEERRVKMMKTTSRLVLNSWCQLRRGLRVSSILWRRRGSWRIWRRPAGWFWTPAMPFDANSEEGRKYQVSYGGGEEGEDDEDDQQIGSELLVCLLQIKYWMFCMHGRQDMEGFVFWCTVLKFASIVELELFPS